MSGDVKKFVMAMQPAAVRKRNQTGVIRRFHSALAAKGSRAVDSGVRAKRIVILDKLLHLRKKVSVTDRDDAISAAFAGRTYPPFRIRIHPWMARRITDGFQAQRFDLLIQSCITAVVINDQIFQRNLVRMHEFAALPEDWDIEGYGDMKDSSRRDVDEKEDVVHAIPAVKIDFRKRRGPIRHNPSGKIFAKFNYFPCKFYGTVIMTQAVQE